MKLYATTTSERSSRGQGGKWLLIEIRDESEKVFATLRVDDDEDLLYPVIKIHSLGAIEEVSLSETKGKKQKAKRRRIM